MDVTTVNNAVSDAIANLPAGTSSFINDNIGTAAGQQAIYNAGVSLGLSQAQIAAVVSQATGQTVTPQQVAQVAATITPAAMPAYKASPVDYATNPAQSPTGIASPTVAPVAPVAPTTSLSNITYTASAPVPAPVNPVNQPFTSSNPGGVGVSYGQADATLLGKAQTDYPELSTALANGTLSLGTSGDQNYLYNTKTGQQINGNYQITTTPSGGVAINLPLSSGAMVQVATGLNQNGSLAPVTASNVYNVGLNAGAGGFAGGVGALGTIVGAAASIIAPELIPFIAAYNSADAASKGQYGRALLNAGISYAGFNPDSALVQAVKNGLNIPTDASGQPTLDSTQPVSTQATSTGTDLSQIGNTGNLGNTDYSLSNTGSSGTGLQGQVGTGTTLYQPGAIDPTTGIPYTGLGLQTSGSTNLSSMGGGQGVTIPAATGASTVPNAVTGGGGTTTIGTGGLPVNTLTNATLGTTLANTNTGVTTPSSLITNTSGNVVGTPAGVNTSTGIIPPVSTNALGLTPVQTAAGLIGGASVLSNLSTNKAIANAAGTQAQAGQAAQGVLSDFGQNYGQLQAPYQQTGVQATNALGSLGSGTYNVMNPDGTVKTTGTGNDYLTHQFNAADLQAGLAPNYDFMLAQGQGANRNLANASGGQISGNTLQGLNKYTQDYAGNAYQNAFANYQTQRQNIYNNLSNQAGLGQTSLGQLGQVGSNLAQTYGNVTTGLAASQAGATTAQAVNNANLLSNLAKTGAVIALA
jgi:hypothetical protein